MQVGTWQAELVETSATEVLSELGTTVGAPASTDRVSNIPGYAVAAAATAALLPTAFSPTVSSYTFTPKVCVLLVVAAVGIVPLARLAWSSTVRWAVRAALAFLAVALLSALLSHSIGIGFFGLYSWGTGWLFWLGCAGAFAIGATLRPNDLNWVYGGLVFGAGVNAFIAIYQVIVRPTGSLSPYDGSQADGLLGNPIHLEAILLGALALVAGRAIAGPHRRVWLLVALVFSVGLEFTLERVAVPILVLILLGAIVVYGIRRAAPYSVACLIGYAGAYLWKGSGLGTRVATGTTASTYGTRLHIWKLALESVTRHPLLGVGPGQVVRAIAPYMSAGFAAHLGPNTLPADAHDFIVEVVATTGLLGLVAFAGWLGGAALRARGPFLICAAAMLAVELVEPLNVGVTPVALLALGVATVSAARQPVGLAALRAWRGPGAGERSWSAVTLEGTPPSAEGAAPAPRRRSPLAVSLTAVLAAGALFLGITMLIGDHYLLVSSNDVATQPKIAAAKDANTLLPYWPDSAESVAQAYLWADNFRGAAPNPLGEAASWYEVAAGRFDADPTVPAELGTVQLQMGDRRAAEYQFLQSLRLDPWNFFALEGLGTIAKEDGDWQTSIYWYERALRVAPSSNDLAKLISSDRAHLT